MSIYENVVTMLILLLFPFCIELLYQVTYQNQNKKSNPYSYQIAVLTSFYFLIKFGSNYPMLVMLFLNIPFLMVINKKDYGLALILSLIISLVGISYTAIPWFMFLIEYLIIFGVLIKIKSHLLKYSIFDLVIISNVVFLYDNPLNSIIIISSFIILSFLTDLFQKYGEDAISFHRTLKDLEAEKQLRMSLFQITHEIKNPITVCKGYLDMFDVDNIEHAKKYVPILKEEIARVLLLIEDFLQITKIKINKEWMDVTMLLEESKRNFELLFKKQHIDCQFEIIDDEIYIYADYQRLNQVLINLIKNGTEALKNNKKMVVKMKVAKQKLTIEVIDYGEGMTKEELDQIKTPFHTTKQGGTGLGLYLSDEIVKAHGGTLVYQSKKGLGTKALITLPYKKDVKIS